MISKPNEVVMIFFIFIGAHVNSKMIVKTTARETRPRIQHVHIGYIMVLGTE